jgi:glycosyltransferase involved in cell wall biosynthesis
MKVSVIIRSYNEADHIERLMLGLRAQALQPHEVILVDSGSTDATVEIARRYGAKVVSIDKAEFTFGRALNRGIATAEGDVCVFPSAHIYPVYDTWIQKLAAPFMDERVVLAYGRQVGGERNKFSEHRIFSRWFPAESALPQRGYFCNNANCAIRRSAWEKQPYDETLTGLEDLAWAKAAQAAGGWLAYVAEAEIVHVHDETWAQVRNRYRREALAMRVIDEHAKFGILDFAWLLPSNVVADFGAALRQGVFMRECVPIMLFRYNQMLGTYLGYNGRHEISAQLRQRFYYPADAKHNAPAEAEHARHRIDYDALKTKADTGRVVRIAGDKR